MQDERELKDFLISGDYTLAEEVIRTHENSLYNLCCRLVQNRSDADDLYQQTWLKVLQKAQNVQAGSFKNWLYTVCINIYRDQYRKEKRRGKVTADIIDEDAKEYAIISATDGISAENIAIKNHTKNILIEEISRLPEKHRIPVVLFYFEDMDYNECAKVLKIPVGTIKSRLNTAKKMLQKEMKKDLSV